MIITEIQISIQRSSSGLLTNMEVDMVADMGVDKVADKVADMVADMKTDIFFWLTCSWTWWPTWR